MADERQKRDDILAAAAGLLAERGYKGTTTRAIAERAGVNEVTVFRQFKNKAGVLVALGEQWAKSMAGFAVSAAPDPADIRATLLALARMEVAQAEEFGAVAMRLAFDAASIPEVAAVMGAGPSDNLAGLAAYFADRQAAGAVRGDMDPRILAEGFFLLTSTLVMSRQLLGGGEGRPPAGQAVEQLVELFLTGVLAKGAELT
jgi:AcrR family transcriptional regulator